MVIKRNTYRNSKSKVKYSDIKIEEYYIDPRDGEIMKTLEKGTKGWRFKVIREGRLGQLLPPRQKGHIFWLTRYEWRTFPFKKLNRLTRALLVE